MKTRTLSIVAILACTLLAFSSFDRFRMAVMKFAETEKNVGAIGLKKPVTVKFEFTNEGSDALHISNVKTSCGCTASDWPKEAIMPGEKATIKATYNAAKLGIFNKSVTVLSNAQQATTRLVLKGEVVEAK